MVSKREICYSLNEPQKDVIWAGKDENGNYFLKIWLSGWKTVSGGQSVAKLLSGSGIDVSPDSDGGYTISIDSSFMDDVNELLDNAVTKEDVSEMIEESHEEISASLVEEWWNELN